MSEYMIVGNMIGDGVNKLSYVQVILRARHACTCEIA
jgi:hypothetical protein